MISFKTYSVIRPVSREVIEDAFSSLNGRDIIFVAPEFAKAQVEREVLGFKEAHSEGKGSIDTGDGTINLSSSLVSGDVLSFRKLAGNILDDLGTNYIAEGGEIMLRNAIYNILANNKSRLKAFGTLSSRIDYINMMIALLGDFSRYGVGIDDIGEAIKAVDNASSTVAFVNKLKDLHLIMGELEQMNSRYGLNLLREPIALACEKLSSLDPSNLSSRRASGLSSLLKSKIIFIGFGATRMLTPKEIRLISLLSDLGCDIEFNVISGDSGSSFSSVYKAGEDFTGMLEALGAAGSELRIRDQKDVLSLIVNGFATDSVPEGISCEGEVRLAELPGLDDRVGYIFNEVISLTREQGYRYRDIRIVCCNEDLMNRMRSTAELYGLDVFIDRKIALGGTVVPYMMQIVLELPRAGFTLELIMKAMRSGMLRIPPYIADGFENYCYAKNITDSVRLFDENAYIDDDGGHRRKSGFWIFEGTVPGVNEGFVDSGRFFYDYVVVRTLMPLKKACESIYGEKTLSGKARKSLEFFNSMRGFIEPLRDEFISRGDDAAAVALVRGYDELISLLMCSTHEMNDCEISQKDFLSMIRTDMRNRTEGTIPLKVDSIEITTPEHAFVTPCKVLFIVGAQKDNFPYVRMREGLLSGIELKNLSAATDRIELPDKAQNKMREEFVTCCLLLGSATDRLYMVHEYGKPKSRVFEYLEGFAGDYHIVNTFKNPVSGEAVKFRHDLEKDPIPQDIMSRLLTVRKDDGTTGKAIYASVSSIESFRECAFQYMLKSQLKIGPREDNTKIQANSFGSLIHGMFEEAYRGLRDASGKDPEKFKTMANLLLSNEEKYNEFADICLRSAASERAMFGSVDKEGHPTDKVFEMDTYAKLRRMFTKMFRGVLKDSVETGFVPEGIEEKIGSSDLVLNIPYEGVDLKFTGYIDRFDLRRDESGKIHLRTIDYKSFEKDVDAASLMNGTQIQLPTYSGAILDKYSEEGDAVIDDYGYVQVGLKASDKGEPLTCVPKLSGYDEAAMKIAIDYSKHIIKESVDQITSGKADALTAEPKLKPCSYCSYKGYCGNDPALPKYRKQPDLGSSGKYGTIVTDCEKFAEPTKSGKARKDPGYDEVTKKIGADKTMKKSDRIAILGMKDILEGTDEKGKEE